MAARRKLYKDKKNVLEWTVFGVGLFLTLSILGHLVNKSITFQAGSPQLFVQYFQEPGHYEPNRYHVILHNKGTETAESIIIEIKLRRNGQELENVELEIDFCPRESVREGWVSFTVPPQPADTLLARVASYKKP
jgi:uncharacterized protein (TIGR02588 family)